MNGDTRCPCESSQARCLCCKATGVTNPGTMGTRTSQAQVPYSPDPVRTPAVQFNRGGYMRSGYDSGRTEGS